ncbi:1367_t:CDS:1, partial [Racocetra fulgida]
SRQASIQEALNFLEAQKTSSSLPLSIRKVAFNYSIAEQILRNAIAR